MEPLQWNEVLATGIAEIDKQHKRIVEILNQLREAIERGMGGEREAAEVALLQLMEYTVYHFAYEEKLLERSGYKPLPLHRRVHQLFIRRVAELQQRYTAGENVLQEIHDLLARWLVQHIQSDDRNYAPIVRRYLRREAKKRSSRAQRTEPLPQQAQAKKPVRKSAGQPSARRRASGSSGNSLWARLSGFMGGDA